MKRSTKDIVINKKKITLKLLTFDDSDKAFIKELFSQWKDLNDNIKKISTRGINLPESISESAFCVFNKDFARVIGAAGGEASFDAINLNNLKKVEIKATSISEDLTSFSPSSSFDELYFLDFSRMDGSFDVYEIAPSLILNKKVSKTQTFQQQQAQGRRPRFSIIKDIIKPNNMKPIKTFKL